VIVQRGRAFLVPRHVEPDPLRQIVGVRGAQPGQLVANAGDVGDERQRLFALAVKGQRGRRGNFDQGRGKADCREQDQDQQGECDPPDQPAPAAGFVKENR